MFATALFGASFVGMQVFEWTKLIVEEGVRPWGNPMGAAQFGSTFFMITGFHGLHVSIGVIYLSTVAFKVWRGDYENRGYEIVEIAGLLLAFCRPGVGFYICVLLSLVRSNTMEHAEGQQHPIGLYLKVWLLLFVLSTMSYMVDYLDFQGYLRWFLILLFMILKAGFIVAIFMHMNWEKTGFKMRNITSANCSASVNRSDGAGS